MRQVGKTSYQPMEKLRCINTERNPLHLLRGLPQALILRATMAGTLGAWRDTRYL
jgi:hypothetical protein